MFVGYSDNGVGERDPDHREGRQVEGPNEDEQLVLGEDIDQHAVNKHLYFHQQRQQPVTTLVKSVSPTCSDLGTKRCQSEGVGTALTPVYYANTSKQRDTEAETVRTRLLAEKCDATTTATDRTEEVATSEELKRDT